MIIILLGAPGAGKGTQGDFMIAEYGFSKLSTGDVLRSEIKQESAIGKKVKKIMAEGSLVPEEIVNDIIISKLTAQTIEKGVILDGYPRNKKQLAFLIDFLRDMGVENELLVLNVAVDQEQLIERLTGRKICKLCGASYHKIFKPEKVESICDKCNGEVIQRPDDNINSVRNRLEVYKAETQPLIDEFSKMKVLCSINGEGLPEQVFGEIKKIIELNKKKRHSLVKN
jgi:adenylate kinase